MSPSSAYRPDIDGLRAIAVMLVLIFHAFPEAVPGGFVGVDVFFVISGFLITGIVARELAEKRFTLAGFYVRRVRRIFPALIVVLAFVLVTGWFCMLPSAYAQLGSDVFASAAFSANIALLLQSGYFDVESAKKPLLHLWSLGIEEQFYLVWPLLLMLATWLRSRLLWLAVVLGGASFALDLVLIGPNPVATFYLPFTRAFELLAGALLALSWSQGWSQGDKPDAASNWRAMAGLALIAIAAALLDSHSPFPGWRAALPVAGAALLLSAPAAWLSRGVLASRPMVRIGLISYPLYLWHWPLLVFFAIIKFSPLTLLERGLILLLSGVLAWLTWRYVETPFRVGRLRQRKLFVLGAGMVLLAALGGAVVWGNGYDFRLPPEIRAMAGVSAQSRPWRIHRCLLELNHDSAFGDDCVDHNRRPLVALWGDSTAGALLPGLRKAQETREFGIAQFTATSCVPILGVDIPGTPNCRANNDKVFALIRDARPDIVLLQGTWEKYLDKLAETVVALKRETGARVVVLGPVPSWRRGLPNEVLRYYMLYHGLIPPRWSGGVSTGWLDAVMRDKLAQSGAEFVSAWDALCNGDGCLTRIGDSAGDIVASDGVHLTDKGSVYLIGAVIDRVLGGPEATRKP